MKDFVEEQKDKKDANVSLAHFLEDIALATDFDSDKTDEEPRVSLMTIHLSKGLEFPYVYIVGMEENLFPSAMSSNTRAELEEERRLFYVALTRAEKQAYLTYAQTRYRWGNLIDCEPSRFIEEIDENFIENLAPKNSPSFNRFVDADIFEYTPPRTIRFKKPTVKPKRIIKKDTNKTTRISSPKNFKKVSHVSVTNNNSDFDTNITEGLVVLHQKFGKGLVTNIEGNEQDKKATIVFDKSGERKLLLKFAKLKIVKQ